MLTGFLTAFECTGWQGHDQKSVVHQHTKLPWIPAGAIREKIKVILKLPYLTRRHVLWKKRGTLSNREHFRRKITRKNTLKYAENQFDKLLWLTAAAIREVKKNH